MTHSGGIAPAVEVYSIDEAFHRTERVLGGRPGGLWPPDSRKQVQQWTGLTVGSASAHKDPGKLANYAAKKWAATGGCRSA